MTGLTYIPTNNYKPPQPVPSPTFAAVYFLNDGHSYWDEMQSHCSVAKDVELFLCSYWPFVVHLRTVSLICMSIY
jgi:hypothetical protein